MKLLDPALGAKARAAVRIVGALVTILTSPAVTDFKFAWVASIVVVLNALLAFLTTFTDLGNKA